MYASKGCKLKHRREVRFAENRAWLFREERYSIETEAACCIAGSSDVDREYRFVTDDILMSIKTDDSGVPKRCSLPHSSIVSKNCDNTINFLTEAIGLILRLQRPNFAVRLASRGHRSSSKSICRFSRAHSKWLT